MLPPQLNESGDTATMIAYPTDDRAGRAHRRDRQDGAHRDALRRRCRETGARVSIGGTTASNLDFSKTIRDKLPLFIGVVVGLSLLLLDGRVPLDPDPGQGRHLQPAVDRRARSAS